MNDALPREDTRADLTWDDIKNLNISLAIAKEAHDQVTRLLADTLETRSSFERRAMALSTAFAGLAIASFGATAAASSDGLHVGLWAAGVMLIGACAQLLLVSHPTLYGTLGNSPVFWLHKETLEGDEKRLARMLALHTLLMDDAIHAGVKANEEKADLIRRGLWTGFAAPILVALGMLFDLVRPLF